MDGSIGVGLPPLQVCEFEVATVDAMGRVTKKHKEQAQYFVEDLDSVPLEMIEIWGGNFTMGSPESEGDADERPQHLVTIAPFFMGRYQITQAQWRVVAGWPQITQELDPDISCFKGDDLPVEQVSYYDALEFCTRLSQRFSRPYRLPSEAEWEYACRAGTSTPFAFGKALSAKIANYDGNCPSGTVRKSIFRHQTVNVGSLGAANNFGLYDMHGNVWEWCQDSWHDDYQNAPTNGDAWIDESNTKLRVLRGGSWDYIDYGCRSAFRDRGTAHIRSPFNGLRVVCTT